MAWLKGSKQRFYARAGPFVQPRRRTGTETKSGLITPLLRPLNVWKRRSPSWADGRLQVAHQDPTSCRDLSNIRCSPGRAIRCSHPMLLRSRQVAHQGQVGIDHRTESVPQMHEMSPTASVTHGIGCRRRHHHDVDDLVQNSKG